MLRGAEILAAIPLLVIVTASSARGDATAPGCSVKLVSVDARNVPSFRGECVWSVSAASVTAVLTDPARLRRGSSQLEASDRLADGRIVNLQKTGWPFEHRQSTIEVRDEPLAGGGVRRWYRLAREQAPLVEGAVQVAVDEGTWEVTAHENGTHLVLEMTYEPGGNLPARLVQSMSPKYIAKGLDELRVGAEKLARENGAAADVASGPPTR